MYNNYGRKYQNTNTQANKALYDIRDNLGTCTEGIRRLQRAIKLMHADITAICNMLESNFNISRTDPKREHTFSHGSTDKQPSKVLSESVTDDEGTRVRQSQRRRGRQLVDLHEQGQNNDGRVTRNRSTFDVSPPRPKSESNYE